MEAVTAYIGLGSNKGDRRAYLQKAVQALRANDTVHRLRVSPVYESEAHVRGPEDARASFLNAVAELETSASPEQLLELLQTIERQCGRRRNASAAWQARTLDLDLLVYDEAIRRGEALSVPHPRMADRRFVLQPLVDLDPSQWIPEPFAATSSELLDRCEDTTRLRKTAIRLE